MQLLSLGWGFFSFVVMIVGFMPVLTVFQWVNVPWSVIGLILGGVALMRPGGENRGAAIVGLACSALAAGIAVTRFVLGPGML